MFRTVGFVFAVTVKKWLPDSFVFALLLTVIAALLSLGLTPTSTLELLEHWHRGFWSMLDFTMQMVLILMLGYIIGISPIVRNLFDFFAQKINKPVTGYFVISLVALTLSIINWGLTPVAAVFAAEVCRRVRGIDYRLACAAVYTGFIPWHGGLSAAAPLLMNTPGNTFIEMGVVDKIIPASATLGSMLNITLIILSFLLIPIIIIAMAPEKVDKKHDAALLWGKAKKPDTDSNKTAAPLITAENKNTSMTPSDILNNSKLLNYVIVAGGVFYLVYHFGQTGLDGLELNSVNFTFLMLGLALHGSPIKYLAAANEAVKGLSALIIQFPFYAGIMGIVMFSGLSEMIARYFISISTEVTYAWFAFLAAAVVNLFIPSGGGEWMVIGPTLISAAQGLGVPLERVIVSFGYGDAITNLINPFWTLAFLPVMTKVMAVKARDFMGYAMMVAIIFFVIISAAIFLVP